VGCRTRFFVSRFFFDEGRCDEDETEFLYKFKLFFELLMAYMSNRYSAAMFDLFSQVIANDIRNVIE